MIKQAKDCLRRLSNNKRNNLLFANIAGFLWKLECHHKHGYYFQFIFFYSDDCGYSSIDLTHQIGQYWVTRLTEGGGGYQNCEESSNEFLSSCIGIVDRTDSESRNKLRQALYYLTMKDQYLRFGKGDAGKRFGRGGVTGG